MLYFWKVGGLRISNTTFWPVNQSTFCWSTKPDQRRLQSRGTHSRTFILVVIAKYYYSIFIHLDWLGIQMAMNQKWRSEHLSVSDCLNLVQLALWYYSIGANFIQFWLYAVVQMTEHLKGNLISIGFIKSDWKIGYITEDSNSVPPIN